MKISEVVIEAKLYPRTNISGNWFTISRYMNALNSGAVFPPIVVAEHNGKYYLVDGLHRTKATQALKQTHIQADVLEGLTQKEIYLEAVKRNMTHGQQFTTQEVTNICVKLEEMKLSKQEIAEIVRIPADKLTRFVADRVMRVGDTTMALKKPLAHLSGTSVAEFEEGSVGMSIEAINDRFSIGTPQEEIITSLISLLKNGLIDEQDHLINGRLRKLWNLLNARFQSPVLVEKGISTKTQKQIQKYKVKGKQKAKKGKV